MPRKPLTEEQKDVLRERMAKARAARKIKQEEKENDRVDNTNSDSGSSPELPRVPVEEKPTGDEPTVGAVPPSVQPTVTLTQEQFQLMLDRLAARPDVSATPEVAAMAFPGQNHTINAQGGVVGVVERYPVDPKYYENPVEKLYDLPQLRRFGMRENYVIEWKVTPTKYQTAQGTWYIEPRFEITLKRKQFDQETNEELVKYTPDGKPFHPRIVLGRASFFEDPPANIIEAEEAGVSIEDLDKPEFQDKMRMYRYAFWLVERLNPRPPTYSTRRTQEEVIGGKVYEIDNYNNPV